MPGMAGGGLPDAEQQILADASVYIDEFRKVRGENKSVEESNKALGESFGKLADDITKIERQLRDLGRNREIVRNFVEMQKAIDAAHEANQRFSSNPAEIEDHTHLIQEATKAYQEATGATEFFTKATTRHIEETLKADEATDLHIQTTNELTAARRKALTVARDLADAHRQVNNEMLRARDIAQARGIDVGYLPGPAFGQGGGGRPDGGLAASTMRAIAADEAGRRFSSFIPAALAAGGGILGAGGLITALGTGGMPDIGRGLGAIGGGIGNVMGGIGGMMGPGPTAADTSRVVTGFMRRWYPAAHWALMLTNELLATAGPAVVAGGMGALTGMQGFEQLIPRGKAIFNTAESLGGSLGTTTGQAWGLKTAYLQNAQDLATGMAAQLAGAAVNIIKSPGTGGAFAQLGLNTDAMFSRFAATLTQDFQKGGMGTQLSNMVTGGTGFLQQFGQVGANLGRTFLNLAPNLPGVGGDLLGTISGGTKLLSNVTGGLGGMLGPILAAEAGMRWGPAIIGTAGRGIAGAGNLLGNIGRGGILSRIGLGTGTEGGLAGLGALLGGLGAPEIGAIAAGGLLLSKGYTYQAPMMGAAQQALTQVGQQGLVAGIPSLISQMQRFARVPATDAQRSSLVENIAGGLVNVDTRQGLFSQLWSGAKRVTHGIEQLAKGAMGGDIGTAAWGRGANAMFDPSGYESAQFAINQLSKSMVNSLNSGQQIDQQWKHLTGTTLGLGKAADVATMAQLQLGTAFYGTGKHAGQLSDTAKTMIANLQAGYAPMQMNAGQFGASVAAQTAMAGLQHTQVFAVNQAFDQLGQLVTGGAAGAANYFGLLGGTPATLRRGGIQFAKAPAMSAMAQALGSFTSPTGAAAWNRLTNQQTGLFPALGGQFDWLREAQTMGALTAGQTQGMASYEMAQLLPSLKGNPAALAMLSTYAQEYGGPGFKPGTSAGAMFRSLSRYFARTGVSDKGYNRLMTLGTEGLSNISADASAFSQQIGSGIVPGLAQQIYQYGGSLQNAFIANVAKKGGRGFDLTSLENYAKFMMGAGVPKQGVIDMARYAGQLGGAGSGVQSQIAHQLGQLYAKLQVQADTSQARAAINNLTHISSQPKVSVKADVAAAQAAINAIKGKDIPVSVKAQGIAAIQAAIDALHGKTITITTINRLITQVIGMGTAPGGTAPATFVGGAAGMHITTGAHASGYRVPGYGGGDRHLALLEGGEAVVPKHLVGAIAPYLSMHNVPGFQGGGFVGQATYGPGAYWGAGSQMALWNPALLAALLAAMRASQGSGIFDHPQGFRGLLAGGGGGGGGSGSLPSLAQQAAQASLMAVAAAAKGGAGQQFGVQVIQGLTGHIKNLKGETASLAKALVNKLETEVKYATGVAQAAAYGQGYDPTGKGAGIFGSMNLASASGLTQAQLHSSPTGNIKDYNAYVAAYAAGTVGGPGPQSVQDQMKSYLGTLKSFGSDITKLRKEHLNKDVMAQIIAAGPQQGDQIAQSILGEKGGVGATNKLWQQIQKESKKLGAQATMAQYGGHLSPDLKHGQVSIGGVTINVNVGGGHGGTLDLTPSQIAQIVAAVQAALLKQAKKNNKTGVKLPGKSA